MVVNTLLWLPQRRSVLRSGSSFQSPHNPPIRNRTCDFHRIRLLIGKLLSSVGLLGITPVVPWIVQFYPFSSIRYGFLHAPNGFLGYISPKTSYHIRPTSAGTRNDWRLSQALPWALATSDIPPLMASAKYLTCPSGGQRTRGYFVPWYHFSMLLGPYNPPGVIRARC